LREDCGFLQIFTWRRVPLRIVTPKGPETAYVATTSVAPEHDGTAFAATGLDPDPTPKGCAVDIGLTLSPDIGGLIVRGAGRI
jgi:hypothetical protein